MPKGVRNPQLADQELLHELYWVRELSLTEIAVTVQCTDASNVRRALQRLGIPLRVGTECWTPRRRARFAAARRGLFAGERNPNWRGGIKGVNGYRAVWTPDHPNAGKDGYVYEHRLVMEAHIGRYLTEEEVVHHRNRCKTDNAIENLQLCANQAEHLRIHAEEDAADAFLRAC
jgi:hypothetical protein